MAELMIPSLAQAQAILRAVADHTGRSVRGAEIYAFGADYIQVTAALDEDGVMEVTFDDPTRPGPKVGG